MSWFLVCLELSDEFWIDLPAGREWLGNPMWLLLCCTTSYTVHTHVHTNVHAQIFVFLLCSYTIASSLLQEEALMMTWQLIGTQQTQYLYPSNAIHMCHNILRLRSWRQHQPWCTYIGTGAGIQGKILWFVPNWMRAQVLCRCPPVEKLLNAETTASLHYTSLLLNMIMRLEQHCTKCHLKVAHESQNAPGVHF